MKKIILKALCISAIFGASNLKADEFSDLVDHIDQIQTTWNKTIKPMVNNQMLVLRNKAAQCIIDKDGTKKANPACTKAQRGQAAVQLLSEGTNLLGSATIVVKDFQKAAQTVLGIAADIINLIPGVNADILKQDFGDVTSQITQVVDKINEAARILRVLAKVENPTEITLK